MPYKKYPYKTRDVQIFCTKVVCDGVESCGKSLENNVCKISRDFPNIKRSPPNKGRVVDLCANMTITKSNDCEQREFVGPAGKIFGLKTLLNVPKKRVNCTNMFGEFYVYLSCMDLCENSSCPMSETPLRYDACPGQYRDRMYSLANGRSLTFVTKSAVSQGYQNNYFQCNNSRCIEYSRVCDLIDDCGDISDEIKCTNHIKCSDDENQLISYQQQCDGIIDCFDLTDECNQRCGKQILDHWLLKAVCWLMGILATLFNFITLAKTAYSFRTIETANLFSTNVLVTVIALADLLNGVYLILISVYDSVVFGTDYCKNQAEWLSSTPCALLGITSTIASQLSLFAMTALSLTRVIGLTCSSMAAPSALNKKAIIKITVIVTMIVSFSAAIALIPLASSLEDYFVQGIYYEPDNRVFIGFPNKEKHVKVLRAYNKTLDVPINMTWKAIRENVDRMFTQQHDTLSRKTVHFYGNDGVCLFKFFVRSDDARRSRQPLELKNNVLDIIDFQGNLVLWIVLTINFICFVIMTVSYVLITIQTWKSSSNSGQNQNHESVQKNDRIQFRISLIIATDFLCWVPFIIISSLHNFQFIDATKWYTYFAMIILPINSVINPLLYDNTITSFFTSLIQRSGDIICNSALVSHFRQSFWSSEQQTDINLEEMHHVSASKPGCSAADEIQQDPISQDQQTDINLEEMHHVSASKPGCNAADEIQQDPISQGQQTDINLKAMHHVSASKPGCSAADEIQQDPISQGGVLTTGQTKEFEDEEV